jgi:hypothetical protein
MDTKARSPKTLTAAIRYYADPDVCRTAMVEARWPDGVVKCPTCGTDRVSFLRTRGLWECMEKPRHPRRQFSVKVGTIFEDSPLGLDRWLPAVWLIANAKNGISSHELGRALGVTQKTGWFMLHRIRLAMKTGTFDKMRGTVEADETFIGGAARFMHKSKRERLRVGKLGGMAGKTAVFGLLERHGFGDGKTSRVRAFVVPNTRRENLDPRTRAHVEPGSNVMTDAAGAYQSLADEYEHKVIDHAEKYVDGVIHTNGIDNFWSLLKRSIKGTYVAVEPFHLFRYVDEQAFRFNERGLKDGGRFLRVLSTVTGRRVDYKTLTGKTLKG